MLTLVQDRGVEDRGEKALVVRQFLLQPSDDVPPDRDVDLWEGFLDHLAEGEACHELHLGAEGHPDYVRCLLGDGREHELPAHVAIDIHLLVFEAGEDFPRDAGPVTQIAFHRVEDE
jgi:hypothetical protein